MSIRAVNTTQQATTVRRVRVVSLATTALTERQYLAPVVLVHSGSPPTSQCKQLFFIFYLSHFFNPTLMTVPLLCLSFAEGCLQRTDKMQCLCMPGYAGPHCERWPESKNRETFELNEQFLLLKLHSLNNFLRLSSTGVLLVSMETPWFWAAGVSLVTATTTPIPTCSSPTVILWPESVWAACTTQPDGTVRSVLLVTTVTPSLPKTAPVSSNTGHCHTSD